MTVATAVSVECLRFSPQSARADRLFEALAAGAQSVGIDLRASDTYRGDADWLVLWGPGHPARFEPMRRQVDRGGHVLAFDLAYWHRETKVRVSIDAAHPQRWVMTRTWPTSRLEHDRVPVANAWNPDGPVLMAGIGEKATTQYGPVVAEWEALMIRTLQQHSRRVIYRPKKNRPAPAGVIVETGGAIDDVLRGCAALVTWHSNVAVDAIRMGIPVVCRDGAAAAICPSDWSANLTPLPESWRDQFLANLAWFQWDPQREAAAFWKWVLEALS